MDIAVLLLRELIKRIKNIMQQNPQKNSDDFLESDYE